MKILIVDDEAMIREWMERTIEGLPVDIQQIDTANDGLDALERFKSTVYDLVFVDVKMPRMNGMDLIKKLNNLPTIPLIVVLTSHDQFDYAREALHLNAYEYILKSECSKEKLLDLINKCQSLIKKKRIDMDLAYHRSAFLDAVLSDNTSKLNFSLNNLFPKLTNTPYMVITYDQALLPDSKLHTLFNGYRRIFIGNHHALTFFAYEVASDIAPEDIASVLNAFTTDYDVTIGCSRPYTGLKDLPLALKRAFSAKQKLFYLDSNYYIDDATEINDDMKDIEAQCECIINNIKSGDLDKARDHLSIVHHMITQLKPVAVDYVKNVNYNILSALLIYLSKSNQRVIPNLDELKSRMENSQHFSDIKSYTDEYFYFLDPVQRTFPKNCSSYVLESINYIHTRYNAIESIAQIANHVHLNTDYFSRLFKKEIGIPASTYLMNYKLEAAAQLLSTTTETVQEISLKVGYSNVSYFSKIFKAKYDLQPSQYRMQFSEH